jgi:hypothetical protein
MTSFVDRCVCLDRAHTHTRAIVEIVEGMPKAVRGSETLKSV